MEISEKDRRLRVKIGAVLGALCALVSLFFAYTAYSQIAESIHSNSWPVARGKVLRSELDVGVNAGQSDSFHPNIRYSYQVAGQNYEANKVLFVNDGFGKNWAMQKVATYPVNSIVEVSYKPSAPEIAVLETNPQFKWYLAVSGAALAFVFVFAGLSWLLFRDVKKLTKI